jgi:hypothetical protein
MDKITAGASQAQDLIVAPSAMHGANMAEEKAGPNIAISPLHQDVSGADFGHYVKGGGAVGNTYRIP